MRRRLLSPTSGLLLLWFAVGAGLALWFTGRIREWSVMTDELQYVKLAIAIAETRSLLPEIHGTSVSSMNQLYPLLIAPVFGALPSPGAFRVAHVLNAVVMSSAVVPVYLLGRQVLPRVWSLAVALLSVVVPWMVLAGFLMTEVAAYPVFVWAVLALYLAIVAPSPRRDLLAAVALGVAILARTQFAVLVVVLPLAILGHELGLALSSVSPARASRRLASGVAEACRRHMLLVWLYAAGATLAAFVAVVGSGSRLLGAYSVTVEDGSVLPSSVWLAAARHVDVVGIGCGLVPLVLGGGWILSVITTSRDRQHRALATLALVTVVALAVETASFDLRFGGADVVRDRYLFYIVPLLLVTSAAALAGGPRRHVAIGAAAVTVCFAATVPQLAFPTFPVMGVDSPASIVNDFLVQQSGALETGVFVAFGGLLLGTVLVLGVLLVPRVPLALALFVAVLSFSAVTLGSGVDRVLGSTALSGRPMAGPPGLVQDWVDAVLPEGATAALIPFPVSTSWETTAIRWWDTEFWNRSITTAYVAADENFSFTPFPRRELAVDWSTGEIAGTTDAPPFVVVAPDDSRFGLAGRQHAANLGLIVAAVERPYRAVWVSRGLETDGWSRPGRSATLRFYGQRVNDHPTLVDVRISIHASTNSPAQYRIATPTGARVVTLSAGAGADEYLSVCMSDRSITEVTIIALSGVRIEGAVVGPRANQSRVVGVRIGPVSVEPTERGCLSRPGPS
jgi:Dolichyl-phosphate-mannose-protein mannosyltransferase